MTSHGFSGFRRNLTPRKISIKQREQAHDYFHLTFCTSVSELNPLD